MSTALDINLLSFSVMCTSGHIKRYRNGKENPYRPSWNERLSMLTHLIDDSRYDFLCFQHVNVHKRVVLNAQFILNNRFKGYSTIYPDIAEIDEIEDFTPIFFNTSRWALDPTDHGVVWYEYDHLPITSKSSIGGQVFVYGLFHRKGMETSQSVYVYSTRLRNCNDRPFMLSCVEQLRKHVLNRAAAPTILAIDTQGKEDSIIVRELLSPSIKEEGSAPVKNKTLYDTYFLKHPDKRRKLRSQHGYNNPHNMSGKGMNDRVVITPGFSIRNAELNGYNRDGAYPSYHYPLEVSLSLFPTVFIDMLYKIYLRRTPKWNECQGHLTAFLKNDLMDAAEGRVRAIRGSKEYARKADKKNEEAFAWSEQDHSALTDLKEVVKVHGGGRLVEEAIQAMGRSMNAERH